MRYPRAAIFIASALGLLASCEVEAQDDVTGVSIETHATFENAGVMVTVSGDANGDAVATLEVGIDGGDLLEAHPLSRTHDDRFVGSAFLLGEGVDYELRVTLEDPDGVSGSPLTASGTTRSSAVPTGSGTEYHVDPGGSDSNPGTASEPFETIAAGLQAAGPGDIVTVHAGTYHEQVEVFAGGEPGNPLTLRAAPGETVVMSGASPELANPDAWTGSGGVVYSAAVAATRYVAVDDLRLWRYESLSDLEALSEGTDGGFFFDGSQVHVRLPGDAAPDGHDIEVSVMGRALWLEGAADTVIQGMIFRCYGGEEYSEAIMVRDGSHRVWIIENAFEHVMPGVWIKNDVDDLAVLRNEFSDRGLPDFPWYAVKAQGGMESGAIAVDSAYDGRGIVFSHNVVHDSFDGINICGDEPMNHPNDADVISNTFTHLADDGIETDGDCSNIRIMLNRFEDALVGVSTAPAAVGPTYVIRNLMVDLNNVADDTDWMTRALKFNVSDPRPSGDVFVYHNTASTFEEGQPAFGVTDDSEWARVVLANNIWLGADQAFYYVNAGEDPLFQDHDLLHSPTDELVYFQGEHYQTIAEYQDATGLCEGCLEGDPLFGISPEDEYYELAESSPAVDAARLIPGVNDAFEGAGPDMGAHELGGIGPDADADADTDADTDADADADTDQETETSGGAGGCGCGLPGGDVEDRPMGAVALMGAVLSR